MHSLSVLYNMFTRTVSVCTVTLLNWVGCFFNMPQGSLWSGAVTPHSWIFLLRCKMRQACSRGLQPSTGWAITDLQSGPVAPPVGCKRILPLTLYPPERQSLLSQNSTSVDTSRATKLYLLSHATICFLSEQLQRIDRIQMYAMIVFGICVP